MDAKKKIKPITQLLKCMEFEFNFSEGEQMGITVSANPEKIDDSELEFVRSFVDDGYIGDLELTQDCIEVSECTLFKILEVPEEKISELSVALKVYDDYVNELSWACDTKSEARSVVSKIKKQRKEITKLFKGLKIKNTYINFEGVDGGILECYI
jgi:hypothetical protein